MMGDSQMMLTNMSLKSNSGGPFHQAMMTHHGNAEQNTTGGPFTKQMSSKTPNPFAVTNNGAIGSMYTTMISDLGSQTGTGKGGGMQAGLPHTLI